MKYGMRKVATESDEEWKRSVANEIECLRLDIAFLKRQLKASNHKMELLTQHNHITSGRHYPTSGTRSMPYKPTSICEPINPTPKVTFQPSTQLNWLMCITAMEQYKNRSLEELRLEDYVSRTSLNSSNIFSQTTDFEGGHNLFVRPRYHFSSQTSSTPSTGFNCFNNQSTNWIAGTNFLKQDSLNHTNNEAKVNHKTDCFDSSIQKEMLGQVLSKLNKMDRYFQNVNTRLTAIDCHLADMGSSLSLMESRLSSVDMYITMQKVGKKWRNLEPSLATLEASLQNQKGPSGEVIKTSSVLESDQKISKEEISDVTNNFSRVSIESVTGDEQTSLNKVPSNLNLPTSTTNIFSKCTEEFSNFSYISPNFIKLTKKGSSKPYYPFLFGSCTREAEDNQNDIRVEINSNESIQLSDCKGKNRNENTNTEQKENLKKSSIARGIKNETTDSKPCKVIDEKERAMFCCVDQRISNQSHKRNVDIDQNLKTSELSESIIPGVSVNLLPTNTTEKSPFLPEKCAKTKNYSDNEHTSTYRTKEFISAKAPGTQCLGANLNDSREEIKSVESSSLIDGKGEKIYENINKEQKEALRKYSIACCNKNETTDFKQYEYEVFSEKEKAMFCRIEQRISVESCVVRDVDKEHDLNTSGPSESISPRVPVKLLVTNTTEESPFMSEKCVEIKHYSDHEHASTYRTKEFIFGKAPGNQGLEGNRNNNRVEINSSESSPLSDGKETFRKIVEENEVGLPDNTNSVNDEDSKSDDFVFLEKFDQPEQHSLEDEQCSVLSDSSSIENVTFEDCNVTEYLEIKSDKAKDLYEFGLEDEQDNLGFRWEFNPPSGDRRKMSGGETHRIITT